MLRFNTLKIYVLAGEAKPGGTIGAMLSPYLFSVNMSDFCKKFNEQSKDFSVGVWLPVMLKCDTVNKTYTFFIKPFAFSMFITTSFLQKRKVDIGFLFDLVCFYSKIYKLDLYRSSLLIFSLLKTIKKRFSIINFSDFILDRLKKLI